MIPKEEAHHVGLVTDIYQDCISIKLSSTLNTMHD